MDNQDPFAQVMEHRRLTSLTGLIYPFQQFNLNGWAVIAFPHAKSHEIICNATVKAVFFKFKVPKKKKPPKDHDIRLISLGESVAMLFGQDWEVLIQVNNGKRKILHARQPLPQSKLTESVKRYGKEFGSIGEGTANRSSKA